MACVPLKVAPSLKPAGENMTHGFLITMVISKETFLSICNFFQLHFFTGRPKRWRHLQRLTRHSCFYQFQIVDYE